MKDPYFRERDLPHYSPNDAPYFITFNLEGAIPREKREEYMRNFMRYDEHLHMAGGEHHLKDPALAKVVFQKLMALNESVAALHAFTVMSNHVHLLFTLHQDQSLGDTLKLVKGGTAIQCNRLLNRRGTFWQEDRFDRVMRRNEFWPTLRYILRNPVRAGIVANWRDHPWTYVDPKLLVELEQYRGGV